MKVKRTTPTTPISLTSAYPILNAKANNWFNKFIKPNTKLLKTSKYGYDIDISFLAGTLAFKSVRGSGIGSMVTLSYAGSRFSGMSKTYIEEHFIYPTVHEIIKPFLDRMNFDNTNCYDVINSLFIHCSQNIPDFTYGNSQKWINMSIKYFLLMRALLYANGHPIDLSNSSETAMAQIKGEFDDFNNKEIDLEKFYCGTKFYGYRLFPVDRKMCEHITTDIGELLPPVFTPSPWSSNNNSNQFMDYWELVDSRLNLSDFTGFIPILYEIYVW